jgi:signal transduction histidine kinase
LYISKSIVEAYEGRMWAENNPDGGREQHLLLLAIKQKKKLSALERMT